MTLGEPGAVVDKLRRFEKRPVIGRHRLAAERRQQVDRGGVNRGTIGVAEKSEIAGRDDPESEAFRHAPHRAKPRGGGRDLPSAESTPFTASSAAAASA